MSREILNYGDIARHAGESEAPNMWQGLVGAWTFGMNGLRGGPTAFDLSGYHNNGAITGASWDSGGLKFLRADVGDNINFGTFDFSGLAGLSVVMGIRYLKSAGGAEYNLLQNYSASAASVLIRIEPATDTLEFIVTEEPNNGLVLNVTDLPIDNAGAPTDIAMVFRGGDALYGYVNGVQSSITDASSANMDASASAVAMQILRSADYFNGWIDYIYICNRALTAGEIADLRVDPYRMWRRKPVYGKAPAAVGGGIVVLRRRRECA